MNKILVAIDRVSDNSFTTSVHGRIGYSYDNNFSLNDEIVHWLEQENIDYEFYDDTSLSNWHLLVSSEDAVLIMLKYPCQQEE